MRLLAKLDSLADNDVDKIRIVEQSTDNCWLGFFALKTDTGGDSARKESAHTRNNDLTPEELAAIKRLEAEYAQNRLF